MLVDLDEQYSEEHRSWYERQKSEGKSVDDDSEIYKNSKIKRFKDAFNNFFEHIKYDRMKTNNGEKIPFFIKEGKEIPIDSLSTGEKQIVFRGTQLMRNVKNMDGGVVMIDEPEISMHPKWQQRILDYYKDLFKGEGDHRQKAQLFIATHSEHVVSSALKDSEDTLVIVLKDDGKKIDGKKITTPTALPDITSAETNYLAFGLCSIEYHQQLYAELQRKTGSEKIKVCDGYIKGHGRYDKAKHECICLYNSITYETVCTFVRNRIDHPNSSDTYSDAQLALSIELMRGILIDEKKKRAPAVMLSETVMTRT